MCKHFLNFVHLKFFGLDGVLYSMPVSDILTLIASAAVIFMTYRKLSAEQT